MKTVIEMAREADIAVAHMNKPMTDEEVRLAWCNEFAALVREDERDKQQEPVAWDVFFQRKGSATTDRLRVLKYEDAELQVAAELIVEICPVYTTPPTAALAARQMRDAAVKVCEDCVDSPNPFISATATLLRDDIAALPLPGEEK